MRIPPCRICGTAIVPMNYGDIDFVVCPNCYDEILAKNKGKYRYAKLTIQSYKETWGATKPSKMQRRYERAMARRCAVGKFLFGCVGLLSACAVFGAILSVL